MAEEGIFNVKAVAYVAVKLRRTRRHLKSFLRRIWLFSVFPSLHCGKSGRKIVRAGNENTYIPQPLCFNSLELPNW